MNAYMIWSRIHRSETSPSWHPIFHHKWQAWRGVEQTDGGAATALL
ncbi:unnamed protein product [Staurois parvus]|uniref:Uncharacterized protein n=1 Tax=Staurois parvus TaxID=386267 RepID=A0ABN9F3I5_9NEOB|nr:unnamed protein product [Staurois parvus]